MSIAPLIRDPVLNDDRQRLLAGYLANLPWVTQCAIKSGRITVEEIETAFLASCRAAPEPSRVTGEDRDYEMIGTFVSHEFGE